VLLSIVVPSYNEQASLPLFWHELSGVLATLACDSEVIFVDDGSKDATLDEVKTMAQQDARIKYVSFSRNFGKEAAIYAGLEAAAGDYVALMDADLQDPPALLPQLLEAVASGEADVARVRRVSRTNEPPIRSAFARLFYRLINKFGDVELVDGARDYQVMNRKVVNAILSLREYNRFFKGISSWVGYRTRWFAYENVERAAGETKWSFWSLTKYAIEGIVSFSEAPLALASFTGVTSFALAILFIIFIVVRKLAFGDPVSGWASTVCIILLIGGLQLLCIGILGQYLSRTFLETKHRPIYLVNETNIKKLDDKDRVV
jgi:glycosyltransferase involved in cell wall biosynthesis